MWIELKRKHALGGIDAPTNEEHLEVNKKITDLVRRVRWRVDQELTRRSIEPLFKDNYAGKYEKHELLIDADIEFTKIKRLLEKNPRILKEDPVLSVDYFKIIGLIKQKKLLEETSDHFDAQNQYLTTFKDPQSLKAEEANRRRERMAKFNKQVSAYC